MSPAPIPLPPAARALIVALARHAAAMDHERDFDTHEPIQFQPGIYEFRLGREYDPYAELARNAAD